MYSVLKAEGYEVIRLPSHVTSRSAVLRAMAACDRIGRKAFREKHGFIKSQSYFVRHNGRTYDSKPLIAVAFGYQHRTRPLAYNDFSGGAATVRPALVRMEFVVTREDLPDDPPAYSSEWLEVGTIYTRKMLREQFIITDRTSDNGVFRPKGSSSIWLFVTQEKPKDRPQLHDLLDGDVLHWDGQPAGRTDRMLIEHLVNGDEVLLFYRENVTQYPGGGFRYEGPFAYRSHTGGKPTQFIFDRDKSSLLANAGAPSSGMDEDPFDPKNVPDGRAQVLALVRRRQGQSKFRSDLFNAYGSKCALSGCAFPPLLEAAHIYPYRGKQTNHVTNGLLLRTDLHTLFDLGLISINADGSVDVCETLKGTEYEKLGPLKLPVQVPKRPSPDALEWHRTTIASPSARAALAKKLGW